MNSRTRTPETAALLPPVEDCEFCDIQIRWVRTVHNNMMKINAAHDPERGNQRWLPGEQIVVQLGNDAAAATRAEGRVRLYVFHGLDCPATMRLSSQRRRPVDERREPTAKPATREAVMGQLAEQHGWSSRLPWRHRRGR